MWGSTTPNTADECTWAKAPFNGGNTRYNESYFNSVMGTVCPNGILAKKYDAASQIMGGDWRMPTEADFQELFKGTTIKWIEDYNGTGVSGRKFTSKADTSKYIFIPTAGSYNSGSVNGVGYYGYFWSSSLNTSTRSDVYYLKFYYRDCYMDYSLRCYGRSVRGVRK